MKIFPATFINNWPPPIPTHPPNHAAPTHPPNVLVITVSDWQPSTTSRPDVSDGAVVHCGTKNGKQDQERIVGGHNADPNEWPWVAVLFNGPRQFCGGSLIDTEHILTAAHCVAQ